MMTLLDMAMALKHLHANQLIHRYARGATGMETTQPVASNYNKLCAPYTHQSHSHIGRTLLPRDAHASSAFITNGERCCTNTPVQIQGHQARQHPAQDQHHGPPRLHRQAGRLRCVSCIMGARVHTYVRWKS